MIWDDQVMLIDHGASLYFHHNWSGVTADSPRNAFPMISSHVLLPLATDIERADAEIADQIDRTVIDEILTAIPDILFTETLEGQTPAFDSPDAYRDAYAKVLLTRIEEPRLFVATAVEARRKMIETPPTKLQYRR